MKENIKDKAISFALGLIIGGAIIYGYIYFIGNKGVGMLGNQTGFNRGNIDPKNMTDEQLDKMANRMGISKDELKKKIESGEDIRSLMPRGGRNRNGSGSQENNQNFTNSGTNQ